jgi:ADP-ribose pyrophosphatase YjhB (NUDIX family)
MSDTFRYCPTCGGPLVARSLKSGDPDRLVCDRCGFVFYLDPKVAVGTIIADAESRIVLVKRAIEPGYGKWVFPGGYVDRGEQLVQAALREAREECGLDVRLEGLVDLYSYPGRTPIIIVYAAALVGGTLTVDDEGLEARWFTIAEVPWTELAFRSTYEAIRDYADGRRHALGSLAALRGESSVASAANPTDPRPSVRRRSPRRGPSEPPTDG